MKANRARTAVDLRDSKGRPLHPYRISWEGEHWGSFEMSPRRSYVTEDECLRQMGDPLEDMGFPETYVEPVGEGQWTLKDLWRPDHCKRKDVEGLCREYEEMASELDEDDEE